MNHSDKQQLLYKRVDQPQPNVTHVQLSVNQTGHFSVKQLIRAQINRIGQGDDTKIDQKMINLDFYRSWLLRIACSIHRNDKKVSFSYICRKIKQKSQYYQVCQNLEKFSQTATFQITQFLSKPPQAKAVSIKNDVLCSSIALVQQGRSPFSTIQCLGCIDKIFQDFNYPFCVSNQNYIILHSEALLQQRILKKAICAAINAQNTYVMITKNYKKIGNGYQIQGYSNNEEVINKIQKYIKQIMSYIVPSTKDIQLTIEKVPIFHKQESKNNQNNYVIRVHLKRNKQTENKIYFSMAKLTNSEKQWNISCFQFDQAREIQQIFQYQMYDCIVNKFYQTLKNKKGFQKHCDSKHPMIRCFKTQKIQIGKKSDSSDSSQQKKMKKNQQNSEIQSGQISLYQIDKTEKSIDLGPYKYFTMITLYNHKKDSVIQNIKLLLTNSKILFQINKIQPLTQTKKQAKFYILSHSCPPQMIHKFLNSCNKQGNLSFARPTKYLTVHDPQFLIAQREQYFYNFFQDKIVKKEENFFGRGYDIYNLKDGSYNPFVEGPVYYSFKKISHSIMAYCWYLGQDVRRLEFRKF